MNRSGIRYGGVDESVIAKPIAGGGQQSTWVCDMFENMSHDDYVELATRAELLEERANNVRCWISSAEFSTEG